MQWILVVGSLQFPVPDAGSFSHTAYIHMFTIKTTHVYAVNAI